MSVQVQFNPKLEESAIEEEAKRLAQEKLMEEQLEREKALAEEQRMAAEAMSNQPAGVSMEQKLCYHIAGKFGGELNLAVWQSAFVFLTCIYMYGNPLPNRQIIKPANIFATVILGPNATHQYFQLYGRLIRNAILFTTL